jgi:hypothetical protein
LGSARFAYQNEAAKYGVSASKLTVTRALTNRPLINRQRSGLVAGNRFSLSAHPELLRFRLFVGKGTTPDRLMIKRRYG